MEDNVMALISCPECGKEVSDKAATCPNCGVSIKQGKLSSLLEKGKMQIPVIQETGQKYIKTMQETGKKHLDTLQKNIQDNPEQAKEQIPVVENHVAVPSSTKRKDDSIVTIVNPDESNNTQCKSCGKFISFNSKFCKNCGADLQKEELYTPSIYTPAQNQPSPEPIDIIEIAKRESYQNNQDPTQDKPNINQASSINLNEAEFGKAIGVKKSFLSSKRNKVIAGAVGVFLLIIIIIAASSGGNQNHSVSSPPPVNVSTTPQPTTQPTPEPLPPAVEIETGILLEYDENILMNRYDIRISINDVPIGILEQGNTEFFELSLSEDVHTLSLSEFGNDENVTIDTFTVVEGSYNYFFIKARTSGIEIERRDTMTRNEVLLLIGAIDDVISTTPAPMPEPEATPEATPEPIPEPTDYILTVDNNTDFATLLSTYFPSQEVIEDFVELYMGRTIEFDGHIFMSARQFHGMRETPPTSLHVFLWNGDSEDAIEKGYHYGCAYFMERVRRIDFPLIVVEDTNVRVVARIDGVGHILLDDRVTVIETYIILVPISIEAR